MYQDSPRGEDEAKGVRHLHRGSYTMPCPSPYQQICSANHNQAFNTANFRAKGSLTNLSVVDSSKLCADASRLGLGFILQQKADNDTWALIQAGSHFLIDSESQYAIIFGCLPHFRVITDHLLLFPILNSHRLDEVENPELKRIKTWIMAYTFTAELAQRKGERHSGHSITQPRALPSATRYTC